MLVEHRAALVQLLDQLPFPINPTLPSNIAEVPCIVVGSPSISQSAQPGILTLTSNLYVLARTIDVAERDDELEQMTDMLVEVLGGSHGTTEAAIGLSMVRVDHRTVSVAGNDHPSYVVAVESSAVTC